MLWFKKKAKASGLKGLSLPFSFLSNNEQEYTPQSAMQQITIFNCVRVLAESIGMLPCKLYKFNGNQRATAVNHNLRRILEVAPNDFMTAQEFWELVVTCLCLRGNFYAHKIKDKRGKIRELLPIDPLSVSVKLTENWQAVYNITINGVKQEFNNRDIWHIKLFTLDGVNGLSPVSYARHTLGLNKSFDGYCAQLFKNGAVTTGVLTAPGILDTEARARMQADFLEAHTGYLNAYKPMILDAGMDWKPISLTAQDSQFIESRKFTEAQICGLFRVPPHLVANLEKMTLNNIEHMGMNFVNYSLVPYLTRIEHRIQVGLLELGDQDQYYAKFNAGALLRGDLKSRYEAYATAIQWGILSANECRANEELNARDGGDGYLTPLNMVDNLKENTSDN